MLRDEARGIRMVASDSEATPEDIKRLKNFACEGVSTGNLSEWYVLLRDTQGDPEATFAAGVMIDGKEFALESLFCEWAYVIDLDLESFRSTGAFRRRRQLLGAGKALRSQRIGATITTRSNWWRHGI